MYTSPIIVSTAIYIRFYLKTKYLGSKKDSGERLSADENIVNTSDEPSLRPQKSVRRNARKEVLEWGGKHSEEKDVFFLRGKYDSLSSKTNFLEEDSKVSFDRIGSSSAEHGEGSLHDETGTDIPLDDPNSVFDNESSKPDKVSDDSFKGSSGTGPGNGGELVGKILDEADEAGNKATRDDKKNRMDLGLAAKERYKRLESLIAKRRAKKLFRMAIEKSLQGLHNVPPSQLGPILMAKINGGVSSNLDEEELQIPGSAPSFKHNSFDLPYGPQEEKPNLMADSFQQEFMPANQKEMLFSRHESFCRGPWSQLATTRNTNYADFNAYYDAEKRLVEGNPELWGDSFNLSREEANRERPRELDDIIEEEPVKVASTSPPEHEAKQNLNSSSSLSSRIDVTKNCSSHPTYINSETHQDSSDCKRGNLETSYEVKSTMKSGKEVEERQPSKYTEQDTRTLTEHNSRDAPNAVQTRSNLKSIPDITVDQNAPEDNILNRRLRDSIARAVNRRLMLEQFSISSSLSPRSVLPQNILADQMPTSEQRMQDLPRSVKENMVRNNLAYEQTHENLTSNMPQISHELVENPLDRSSGNCSLGELQVLKKVIEKGNKNINTSAVNEKEQGKKLTANDGESEFIPRPEDISGPGKSNEQEADMNKTEAIEPDYTIIVETAKERENSAAKVDRICKVNGSVADNVTNKETKNDVLEREGALQIFGKLKAAIEPSNTTRETSAGSIEETEHESKRLAEAEANAGLTTSAGETNSLNNIKNDEKMQNMTSQEGVMDESQSGEVIESILNVDNIAKVISINHEAMEASKPTESEVKADKMIKYDTGIDPSKLDKENDKSDNTETMEPINSPKVIKEGNIVKNINDLAANEEKWEKLTTNEGEYQFSITQDGIIFVAPEKSNELELDLNKTEPVESDYTSIVETAKERENSAAEVDRICKVNESLSDNATNKEIKSDALKREDALRILGKLEAVLESSKTTGESSSGSIEDAEHESKRLADADANAGLSTSAGETNSLCNINNGEEMQNMTRQEGITNASQSGEDNLKAIDKISDVDSITKGTSIDRDIDVKASKPTESEFQTIKTDEKDSNAVAK